MHASGVIRARPAHSLRSGPDPRGGQRVQRRAQLRRCRGPAPTAWVGRPPCCLISFAACPARCGRRCGRATRASLSKAVMARSAWRWLPRCLDEVFCTASCASASHPAGQCSTATGRSGMGVILTFLNPVRFASARLLSPYNAYRAGMCVTNQAFFFGSLCEGLRPQAVGRDCRDPKLRTQAALFLRRWGTRSGASASRIRGIQRRRKSPPGLFFTSMR